MTVMFVVVVVETADVVCAGLWGHNIYLFYVYLFAADPNKTKYPRMGLVIGLPADFKLNLHYLPNRIPSRGVHRGPKIDQQIRGQIHLRIFPDVCPAVGDGEVDVDVVVDVAVVVTAVVDTRTSAKASTQVGLNLAAFRA